MWTRSQSRSRGPSRRECSFAKNAQVLHRFGWPYTRILKRQRLKTHFFEKGSQGGKIRKRSPPVVMWTANPHTFQNDTASPHPSTSCLRLLNPATSHNNNNNNGGLHARVCATEDIQPSLQLTPLVVECESQQQFDLINGPHKQFWFPCTSHFIFFLLCSVSPSTVCLFTERKLSACSVSSSPFLVNVKRHL